MYYGRQFGPRDLSDQLIHLMAVFFLATSAVIVIRQLGNVPVAARLVMAAVCLAILSQTLSVCEQIPLLDGIPVLGKGGFLHEPIENTPVPLAVVLLLSGFFVAALEAHRARERLAIERQELAEELAERKRAEKALDESEEKYRDLVENLNGVVYAVSGDGLVTYISPAIESLTGYGPSEFIGQPLSKFVYEDDLPRMNGRVREILAGNVEPGEYRLVKKSGEVCWVLTSSRPILEGERTVGLRGTLTDISERKQAEEALRRSEAKLRQIIDLVPAQVFAKDLEGRILLVDRAGADTLGMTVEEMTGRLHAEIHPDAEEVKQMLADDRKVIEGGQTLAIPEEQYLGADGQRRWLRTSKVPYITADTSEPAILGVAVDITERKRMEEELSQHRDHLEELVEKRTAELQQQIAERKQVEEALRESEEKYRVLIDSAGAPVSVFDTDGVVLLMNSAGAEYFGVSREEIVGKSMRDLFPDEVDVLIERNQQIFESGVGGTFEDMLGFPTGKRWFLSNLQPLKDPSGETYAVQIVSHDITERKRAEEEVKASLREKEVLLREIHHRVKNNLQSVGSLLNLQARRMRNEAVLQALEDSRNRIRAMFLIHETLYQSKDLSRVHFRQYVAKLVKNLRRAYGSVSGRIGCDVRGDDPPLAVDDAVPLGLVINELLTNAFRHAFPEGARGEISVTVRQIGEGEIELAVDDNGVGLPADLDVRDTETLGLQLVRDLAEGQLGGSVEVDRDNGTQFRIRLKGIVH